MAFFIPLLLTTADPIDINVAHIMAYRLFNKNVTQITLSNGADIYVEDTPEQIAEAIGSTSAIDAKLDSIELQIDGLGAEFDRIIAELGDDADGSE